MIMRSKLRLTLISAAILFSACSEAPKKAAEKAPELPPEPVTGSTAFFRMYTAARGWAADLQPLRMTSIHLPDLTWRVIWGDSVGTSNFSVFVDATTGEYLETMR